MTYSSRLDNILVGEHLFLPGVPRMDTTIVYVDKLFIGNLLMDGLLLWAAAGLSQIRVKYWRVFAGACLGGLYSVAVFLPGTEYLNSFFAKFAASLAMAAVVFLPLPPRRFFICLSFFYLVSFLAGGIMIGFTHMISSAGAFTQTGNFLLLLKQYLWAGILLALAFLWTSVAFLPRYMKNRQRISDMKMPVTIFIEGHAVTVRGLIDTGSSLYDPVSGEPVVVVDHNAIRKVLPGPMGETGAFKGDAIGVFERMIDSPWSCRLRLIPFHSLGNNRGTLVGIKPDRVEFFRNRRLQKVEKVVIGIHHSQLDSGKDYDAIINPALLEMSIPA